MNFPRKEVSLPRFIKDHFNHNYYSKKVLTMQGKGVIKFFLVVMTIVTVGQYLFILPTRKVENAAEKYASEKVTSIEDEAERNAVFKSARTAFLDSMSSETVFEIPFIKSWNYQELKAQQLAFGLDLQGGMSVVLQVDLRGFIEALANNSKDPTFLAALDKASEAQKTAQSDYVTLFARAFDELTETKTLASIFSRNEALRSEINTATPDGEVVRIIREKADETVDLTFKLLKERIDKLGVAQPNVSLDAGRDLILVELPGVDNPERARTFLQAAAKLEFWDVHRISDQGISQAFITANDRLSKSVGSGPIEPEMVIDTTFATDSLGNEIPGQIVRIDTFPSNQIQTDQGPLFEVFALNTGGLYSPAVIGTARGNQRRLIDTLLARPEVAPLFKNMKLRWSKDPVKDLETGEETDNYELFALKLNRGSDEPPLTGEHVIDAFSSPDPQTGEVGVSLSMDPVGTRIWGNMTTQAAQDNNREIAILLDDEVVSAPRVNTPITDGRSLISGSFTVQEGKDLANILQIGKLPAETKSIQESLVGPYLGAENIRRSINALVIGFVLVLGFMILYYGGAGIVSILALLLNLFFISGALASFGTVLTLAGIAGIVLTIGMAVDANVIIFERIREELREGKTLLMAVADGFKNSYSAILDANVTTFLTAGVLFYFGLGPIKGFAVVLMIGVAFSLFTAVLVGRLIIDNWIRKRDMTFWTGFSKNAFANLSIDWLSKTRTAYVFSGIIILLGIGSFFLRGFELGVDFKGGYAYNIAFEENISIDAAALRNSLAQAFADENGNENSPIVKEVDTKNTYSVVTDYLVDNTDDDAADRVMAQLYQGVNAIAGGNIDLEQFKDPDGIGTHVISSFKVLPTIADDIKQTSVYAAIFALLLIFLYIFIRFSKWQYSMGAVAALFHDVLVVLGVFSLLHGVLPFAMEINQEFIAAILTVIGYSINDTVVVFDRIREYANIYVQKSKKEIINLAINSTVSRTVITSLTTLFVVLILFVFGGTSIKGFAFAILVGILIGTYSSIFVATPVMSDLSGEFSKDGKRGEKKRFSKKLEKVR